MRYGINRVAVIGAGTMGAAIAAHCANAGVPVYLLDAAPSTLTPEEVAKGLALESPAVRNRLVKAGFERMCKARPAALFGDAAAELITLGNTEDNLDWLDEADWILEAIVEQLEPKRALMAAIEARRKPRAIVSTNTSGIPVREIAAGRSIEFKRHFLGTHFFNPPRYMKLLEVIPTDDTDPEVVRAMSEWASETLGKGIVVCKDTPNFIANRLGSFRMNNLRYIFDHGFTVEEVDALTGPLIGLPKTATFRLSDLAGIDISATVARNLQAAVPHDESRDALAVPPMLDRMIEAGKLGNKTGGGFYKEVREGGKKAFWVLDFATMEYRPPRPVHIPLIDAANQHHDLDERLRFLLHYADDHLDDRYAQLVANTILPPLAYAAHRAPEISDRISSLDHAMQWGYGHQRGPFAIWDTLGVAAAAERMRARGIAVAAWVEQMLAGGNGHFYTQRDGQMYEWSPIDSAYVPVPRDPREIDPQELKQAGRELQTYASGSLFDLGDGVLLLLTHTKIGTIHADFMEMMRAALETLEAEQWAGLVIGSEGDGFFNGATFVDSAAREQEGWQRIDERMRQFQTLQQTIRYNAKPVVAAISGRVTGIGAEIAMNAPCTVAAGETSMGLVEAGAGPLPAAGGCAELIRRIVNPHVRVDQFDPVPAVQRVFQLLAPARTGGSAVEAREMGLLRPTDRIVMNRDHLLHAAKGSVLDLVAEGYRPPVREKLYAAGRDTLAALKISIHALRESGRASEHERQIALKLAHVLCGGELSPPQLVDEQYFLDLEREALLKSGQ